MKVMTNKNKLLNSSIYIENELTWREMQIQKVILKRRKEEKDKGHRVKIGYRKLQIDGSWYVWNTEKQSLIKEEHRNFKKLIDRKNKEGKIYDDKRRIKNNGKQNKSKTANAKKNKKLKIGTWNIRTMLKSGKNGRDSIGTK